MGCCDLSFLVNAGESFVTSVRTSACDIYLFFPVVFDNMWMLAWGLLKDQTLKFKSENANPEPNCLNFNKAQVLAVY